MKTMKRLLGWILATLPLQIIFINCIGWRGIVPFIVTVTVIALMLYGFKLLDMV